MRKRKTPIDIFNIAFLDMMTTSGGIFWLLLLLYLTFLFIGINAISGAKVGHENNTIEGLINSINKNRETLSECYAYIDSLNNIERQIDQKIQIYEKNRDAISKRRILKAHQNEYDNYIDSLAKINNIIDKLTSNSNIIDNASKKINKNILRPAVDIKQKAGRWDIIIVVKRDSIYSLRFSGDSIQFIWNTDNSECSIRHGSGEETSWAISKESIFNRNISKQSKGDIALIQLYEDSFESYPTLRDYLLSRQLKIAIEVNNGEPLFRFSNTGWSPRAIY